MDQNDSLQDPSETPLQIQRILEIMEGRFPSPVENLAELLEQHQKLCNDLARFDLFSSLQLVVALDLVPALQENTIRISALLHLVMHCCKGEQPATARELSRWCRFMAESPMSVLEDPAEDVYIGYVCSSSGGFRVYPGIFTNADFILERLLVFLHEKTDHPVLTTVRSSIIALLKLSEAMAERLDHTRYSTGGNLAGKGFTLPSTDVLERESEAITFTSDDLGRLEIDIDILAPFFLNHGDDTLTGDTPLSGSPIEHHPLVRKDDGLIVLSPTSICRAATVHFLEATTHLGGFGDLFFAKESAEFFVNEITSRLGIKELQGFDLPMPSENLPDVLPWTGQFDYGMPILVLSLASSLSAGPDLETVEALTKEQLDDFNEYVDGCCAAMESTEGFKGGLILLSISTVGREVVFGLRNLRSRWHILSGNLAEWYTLSLDRDLKARRLWYLVLQREMLKDANVEVLNHAGLINLYGYWKSQGYSLLHKEIDPKNSNNLLTIDGSYARGVNAHNKTINDRHSRLSHDRTQWFTVQREGKGLNPDISTSLRYVEHEAARMGFLRCCVEYAKCVWWMELLDTGRTSEYRDLAYQLWDCISQWMERIIVPITEILGESIQPSLMIRLSLPEIEQWNLEVSGVTVDRTPLPKFDTSIEAGVIELTIPEGFLSLFHHPNNIAEREIVKGLVLTIATLHNHEITEEQLGSLTDRISGGNDARFFHVLRSSSLAVQLRRGRISEPGFVPEEETERHHIRLAHEVIKDASEVISGKRETVKFLNDCVSYLQTLVANKLKNFAILPVVSLCFEELDELERNGEQWSLSTRALLALGNRADWIQQRLQSEKVNASIAEIANRILIETAVYSNNKKATEIISLSEHGTLLAALILMIRLANYRDAIANGYIPPEIKIRPNGTLEMDEVFHSEVFEPYILSRIDERINWDSETYASYFDRANDADDTQMGEIPPEQFAFLRAFEAEFSFTPETLWKVVNFFTERALERGEGGGAIGALHFRKLLQSEIGLSQEQAAKFIERFTLPLRKGWNRDFPKGCEINDVFPWRYWRGLSVIARPFVEISKGPREFAISATHLNKWLKYFIHSLSEGYFPDRLFQSKEMKSYLGTVANREGHEFTKEVASEIMPILPNQREEINLTELGAPAMPNLGDIDVFAWDVSSGNVFLMECKRLKAALTVGQVVQQLEDFKGEIEKLDYLGKHKRRCQWLRNNPAVVEKLTGIPSDTIKWHPLLVTKGRVPMSFIDAIDFPKEQVVAFDDLPKFLIGQIEIP